jgi:hypothetical protein
MAFDTETETQVSTVFPNEIRKYFDGVCFDLEMTRSQFVRKSVKENLREYAKQKGELEFLDEIYNEVERKNQVTPV